MFLFAYWFAYQDFSALSIDFSSVVILFFFCLLSRFIGQVFGFYEFNSMIDSLPVILIICIPVACLCIKKWMGWGDFFIIFSLLITLKKADMMEMMEISFVTACVVSIFLLLIKKVNRRTPIPFLPFLWIGYLLALFFDFRYV
jgi:prepilin signal peptidase PulO-like enzyme (type II secretory pathway)